MASAPGGSSGRRQRRMGPAPFASFEDLSDETESSPSDGATQRLPGITEDTSLATNTNNLTPNAPRIDISRASSSSHHEDSRDSTPERELFQTSDQGCTRLGLAFKEEGALELRSSTEELDFQDVNEQRRSPVASVTAVTATSTLDGQPLFHQRKDSQGSEFGGLLSISGRTSRLSSIGSQGSRVSEASRLSVTSGMSRSPSPHKMLLETSFCGSKTEPGQSIGLPLRGSTKLVETELLERVLLSRKHDPTEAVLAEGISIECRRKIQPADPLVQLSPVLQHAVQQSPETPCQSLPAPNLPNLIPNSVIPPAPTPPEKPARKSIPAKVSSDVIITVNKPSGEIEDIHNTSRRSSPLPGKIVSESGIEYTFIPLKGPLPKENEITTNKQPIKTKNASCKTNSNVISTNSVSVKNVNSTNEPHYIRIKLKPDYMYPDEPQESHSKPVSLDLSNGDAAPTVNHSPLQFHNSPSPSVSRKSSFSSLFRGKDYGTSPESPTVSTSAVRRKPQRSRSKSSDRDRTSENAADKPSKHRSVFTLFKSKKNCSKSKQSLTTETSPCRQTATSLHNLEFTFDQPPPSSIKKYYEIPLEGDSIIIPLHSPGSEPPPPLPLYADDTPDIPKEPESTETNVNYVSNRQSSTSSENVVFSTNLGSENTIFTTKLPKRNKECDEFTTKNPDNTVTSLQLVEILQSPVHNGIDETKLNQPEEIEKINTEVEEAEISDRAADSSESEREILPKSKAKRVAEPEENESGNEHERKGLVLQDSFDDELPYIPTTLPLERSVAVPIVPIKQRASYEIRTCPIERPRSTTPINPSCLEDYCEDVVSTTGTTAVIEKLRISLPREDSIPGSSMTSHSVQGRGKSPRRWTEFIPPQQEVAPPLPPRGAPREWINFEEIPERRKPPKRIQTIPSRGNLQPTQGEDTNVIYSYVNPEDCKCECHESSSRPNPANPTPERSEEDELPLLSTDRRSDSSPESQGGAASSKRAAGRNAKSTIAFSHITTSS